MGKSCSRFVLAVALWYLLCCPGFSSPWLFDKPPPLVAMSSNVERITSAHYFETGTDLEITCQYTEEYTKKHNASSIYLQVMSQNWCIFNKTSTRILLDDLPKACLNWTRTVLNDSAALFTLPKMSYAAGKYPGLRAMCCSQKPAHLCTGVEETFYTVNSLLPISMTSEDCIVTNFVELTCKWKPSIEQQVKHTGVGGKHDDLKVQQFLCWNKRRTNEVLPDGKTEESHVESCGTWFDQAVDEGDSYTWMGDEFDMGATYDVDVHITDLFDRKVSQRVTVNTTNRVQTTSVSGLHAPRIDPRAILLHWTLPSIPRQHIQPLEVFLEYQSEWQSEDDWTSVTIPQPQRPFMDNRIPASDSERPSHHGNVMNYTLQELVPFTDYTCRMKVKTRPSEVWSNMTKLVQKTRGSQPDLNPVYIPVGFSIAPWSANCKEKCVKLCARKYCHLVTLYWQLLHKSQYYAPESEFKYLLQYRRKPINTAGSYSNWKNQTTDSHDDARWTFQWSNREELQVRVFSHNSNGTALSEESVVMSISQQGYVGLSGLQIESQTGNDVTITWKTTDPEKYSFWLVVCSTNRKVHEHNCAGQLYWKNVSEAVDAAGNGVYNTTLTQLTAIVDRRRQKRSAPALSPLRFPRSVDGSQIPLKKLLLAVVAQQHTPGAALGIVWPDFYYLNTQVPETPVSVQFTKCSYYELCVSWTYPCEDTCSRPAGYLLQYRKNDDKDGLWQDQTVAGSQTTGIIEDLDSDSTYNVTVIAFLKNGKKSSPSKVVYKKVIGSLLGTGAIAGIVLACLFIIALVGVCIIRKCYKLRKQWHNMDIQLPGTVENRKYLESTSSRYPVLTSQSSSEPSQRHYSSQLSDDSRTALIPSSLPHHHGDNGLLTHTEEDVDDVFIHSGTDGLETHPELRNGHTGENEMIPMTPISAQQQSSDLPNDRTNHANLPFPPPGAFIMSNFPTIESEYLHPVVDKPSRSGDVGNSQDSLYHENMEAYCRVCVREPVERDDREGSYYPKHYGQQSCTCKGDITEEGGLLHSGHSNAVIKPSGTKEAAIQQLAKELSQLHQPLVPKEPTEDYWKDSGSGTDSTNNNSPNKSAIRQEEETADVCGEKGVSDPFLNRHHKQSGENLQNGNSENNLASSVSGKKLGNVHNEKDLVAGTSGGSLLKKKNSFRQAVVSKSNGCISSLLLTQPNGYVSISEGDLGSSLSNQKKAGIKPAISPLVNSIAKSTPNSRPTLLSELAKKEYVSQEDIKAAKLDSLHGLMDLKEPEKPLASGHFLEDVSQTSSEHSPQSQTKNQPPVTTSVSSENTAKGINGEEIQPHTLSESGVKSRSETALTVNASLPPTINLFNIPSPKYDVENPRTLFDKSPEVKLTKPRLPCQVVEDIGERSSEPDSQRQAILDSVAASTKALKESLKKSIEKPADHQTENMLKPGQNDLNSEQNGVEILEKGSNSAHNKNHPQSTYTNLQPVGTGNKQTGLNPKVSDSLGNRIDSGLEQKSVDGYDKVPVSHQNGPSSLPPPAACKRAAVPSENTDHNLRNGSIGAYVAPASHHTGLTSNESFPYDPRRAENSELRRPPNPVYSNTEPDGTARSSEVIRTPELGSIPQKANDSRGTGVKSNAKSSHISVESNLSQDLNCECSADEVSPAFELEEGEAEACPAHLKPKFRDFSLDGDTLAANSLADDNTTDRDADQFHQLPNEADNDSVYCKTDLKVENDSLVDENAKVVTPILTPLLDDRKDRHFYDDVTDTEDNVDHYCKTNVKKMAAVVGQTRDGGKENGSSKCAVDRDRSNSEDSDDKFYVSTALSYNVT